MLPQTQPFDVILFDVGGVLLTNGWDHGERARVVEHFQLDRERFEALHPAANEAWEKDQISVGEYLDKTVFYEPRSFTKDDFVSFMLTQSQLLPDSGIGVLAELAASNAYLVGALNNEARVTNDYRFSKFELRRYFKIALSSCYVGLRKPDLAIYRRALDILGVAGERVLFIDDRQENADAAKAAGMKTIRYQGSAQLRTELASVGVIQPI